MRARYQVLILPYKRGDQGLLYGIFKRRDVACWQFLAGGGEIEDQTPLAAARREAFEEAGINPAERYIALETQCSISTEHFPKARKSWGEQCLIIPEQLCR